MTRKVIYWVSTGVLAAFSAFAAVTYLLGSPQAIQGFAHVGYPQHLRIILGIAKFLGAIILLAPGLARLKEWAYAGMMFDIAGAVVSRAVVGDGVSAFAAPVAIAAVVIGSWLLRPPRRMLRSVVPRTASG